MPQNQKVVKNPTPKKGNQGRVTPLLDMAITHCQNFQLEITGFLLMFAYSEVVHAYFYRLG